MAGEPKSHLRIEKNRHWEDYQSLKKYWSSAAKFIREYIFNGTQTSTDTAAEFKSGTDATIAFLGANDLVYARTEADLAALDGDSLWMDYVSSTGDLYENVETTYDVDSATTVEVPIGFEGTLTTVASVVGDTVTLTGVDSTVANDLAGMFIVACGDATDQEGAYLEIESNTVASPTVITCTSTPNANWADDNISLQSTVHPYVYRIRRLWAETESPANNYQCICDKDKTNVYATVDDTNTFGSAGSRYFALSSDYRCFLGHVHAEAPISIGADGDNLEHMLTMTFTPKVVASGQAAADITITRSFNGALDWQPCIELEPCTDVTFKIHKVLNQDYVEVGLDYEILEVKLVE